MSGYETIGGLRGALSALDGTAEVYIDGQMPTALSSYRGIYADLAIECSGVSHERTELSGRGEPFELNMAGYGTYRPGHSEVRIKTPCTVSDLIAALDMATGEEFEGYKGGQFRMDSSTDLWVSEYGRSSGRRITAGHVVPGRVDLSTRVVEF